MSLLEIRILPPLAIGRLGSSPHPLDNFDHGQPADGLDFRRIEPAESLHVDEQTGEIVRAETPKTIRFADEDEATGTRRVRPVAPFLQVFARTGGDTLEPLTIGMLRDNGLTPADIHWSVAVGNIKAYRRTRDPRDKALARAAFTDHAVHRLDATAENFLPGAVLPLGTVRYIKPNDAFPEIRLRFTPAAGLVYGASDERLEIGSDGVPTPQPDAVVRGRVIYDGGRATQKWRGWIDDGGPDTTNPGAIFAGYDDADGNHVGWGYLDDECDGLVTVMLTTRDGAVLSAFARLGAGPPAYAPDGLPVRTVHDELLQAALGPTVATASMADTEDTLRRGFESVRLMNTAVMNGNTIAGRTAAASMMPSQDSNDTHRLFSPVLAPSLVDTGSVLALHHGVMVSLRAGTAPWFADVLRRPEEIGDLSDAGRRKMPALMRGADGRYMTLTRRQIDNVEKVARSGPFAPAAPAEPPAPERPSLAAGATVRIAVADIAAQLAWRGRGNPPPTHPSSAISNCFPGLEFDFRNVWRRVFVGLILTEHSNYVVDVEDEAYRDLKGRRLLAIAGRPVMRTAVGPVIPGRGDSTLATAGNAEAVAFMEWSNTIALVWDKQGQQVSCVFTRDESPNEVLVDDEGRASVPTMVRSLEVRRLFEPASIAGDAAPQAVLARALAEPGELTQGLCSPWQNDYRECACYYWAASRPDFVNVEPTEDGTSRGDNWMQLRRTGDYLLDDRRDTRLVTYDDLFKRWEDVLQFAVRGRDADNSGAAPSSTNERTGES